MHLFLPVLALLPAVLAQSTDSGYTDYSLSVTGDPDSTLYSTSSTNPNATTVSPPDVFLNASVHVGEIDILVEKLAAKITLDAQVLNLLQFSAGVDVSIGKVNLQIQNVTAKVFLEARLENVVRMINSTLDSIDLNPIIAELGNTVGTVVGDLGDVLGGSSTSSAATSGPTAATGGNLTSRSSFVLEQNILYSVNDYSGNTHKNRVLTQTGDLVDQSLDNEGHVYNQQVVGNYETDMTFTGHEHAGVIVHGMSTTEKEYTYAPLPGLIARVAVYFGAGGNVVATRILGEVEGGGMSTISGEGDD